MRLYEKFFPHTPPVEQQLAQSRRIILAEEAIAGTIFSLGIGNFLVGYLTWMGASPAFSALVGALPMLGCILQAVSPFLFERLRYRKLCIVLVCLGFRFSMGLAAFVPLLFSHSASRQTAVFLLYFFACMCAGFVTPGLNQWILSIAPQESRGNFFAKKNILNSIVNASVMFLMGRQLDYFIGQGQPQTGYFIVYGTILLLTFLDIALLSHVWETPSQKVLNIRPQDFLRPFRDRKFRGEFFLGVPTGVSPARAGAFPQLHQRHDDSCLRDGDLLQLGLGAHGGSQGLALCTHRGQRAFLLWLHGLVSHHTDSGAVRRAGFAVHRHRRFVGFQPCHAEHGICVLPRRGENRIPRRGGCRFQFDGLYGHAGCFGNPVYVRA